jgi:hypothetical protein
MRKVMKKGKKERERERKSCFKFGQTISLFSHFEQHEIKKRSD